MSQMHSLPEEILKKILEGLTIDELRKAAQVDLCLYKCAAKLPRLYRTESHDVTNSFQYEVYGLRDICYTVRVPENLIDMAVLPDDSMLASIRCDDSSLYDSDTLRLAVHLKCYKDHTIVPYYFPFYFYTLRLTDDFIVARGKVTMVAPIRDPRNLAEVTIAANDAYGPARINAFCISNEHAYILVDFSRHAPHYMVRMDLSTHEQIVIYEFCHLKDPCMHALFKTSTHRMAFCKDRIHIIWEAVYHHPKVLTLGAFPSMSANENTRPCPFGEIRCPIIGFGDDGRILQGIRVAQPREIFWKPFASFDLDSLGLTYGYPDEDFYVFGIGDKVGVFVSMWERRRVFTHLHLYSVVPNYEDNVQLQLEDYMTFTSSEYPRFSVHKDRIHILRPEGMTVLDWCALTPASPT